MEITLKICYCQPFLTSDAGLPVEFAVTIVERTVGAAHFSPLLPALLSLSPSPLPAFGLARALPPLVGLPGVILPTTL